MAAHRPLGRRLRVINENYTSLAPQNTLFPSQHVASCYTDPMPATGTYSYSSTSTFSETLVTWNPLIGGSALSHEAPFGTIISQSGDAAEGNPFRFSTKYHEAADVGASGDTPRLVYYGYRFYDPEFGRWVSRDPLGDIAFSWGYRKGQSLQSFRHGHNSHLDGGGRLPPSFGQFPV